VLKLFAPFLPFATEEVWSWWRQDGSIHRSSWPSPPDAGDGDPLVLEVTAAALSEIRKAKSEAKRSMRTEVDRAVVADTPERLAALRLAEADLREAGRIAELALEDGDALGVTVTLAPEPPSSS